MKYALCNETFQGWEWSKICETLASLGYTGVEVAPFTLASRITDLSSEQKAKYRRLAEAAGLQVLGLHWLLAKTEGFHLTSCDPLVRQATADYLGALARAARDLGGDILVLGSPQQRSFPVTMTYEQAEAHALTILELLLPVLEETQVKLCLEPLTTKETNFMNQAVQARSMIEKLGSPELIRLHLDVKAMAAELTSRDHVIKENADLLYHFHANDENLRGPGFGEVDFLPIFQALRDIDYQGWVSVEVFDYSPDPLTIARESLAYMKSIEEKL